MRTANWDVVRLAKLVTKGMTVVIEGPSPEPRPVPVATPQPPPPPPEPAKKWFQFWKKSPPVTAVR
jgi:hypothetical protein